MPDKLLNVPQRQANLPEARLYKSADRSGPGGPGEGDVKHMAFAATLALTAGRTLLASAFPGVTGTTACLFRNNTKYGFQLPAGREVSPVA